MEDRGIQVNEKRSVSQMNVATKYQNLQIKTVDEEEEQNQYHKTEEYQPVLNNYNSERYKGVKEYAPVLSNRRPGSNHSSQNKVKPTYMIYKSTTALTIP